MIDPLTAFYARVANDAALKGILGVKAAGTARFYPEFPDESLGEADYPRGTFLLVGEERTGSSMLVADIQTDLWVWKDGANGGPAKLSAADDRMLELLNGGPTQAAKGIAWTSAGARVFSREVGARDFPTDPGAPLRRRRTYRLTVS